jgi:hypothetical protein
MHFSAPGAVAEKGAMIGPENDQGLVEQLFLREGIEDPSDLIV